VTVSRWLEGQDPARPTLVAAGIALDTRSNEVRHGARHAHLAPVEARILRQLLLEAS
jgi:DNA-binding response OmpR family regulator